MPLTKTDLKQIEKLLDIQSKTLRGEIRQTRKEIYQDVGKLIVNRILPQIDLLHDELESLNRRMDAVFCEVGTKQLEQASL